MTRYITMAEEIGILQKVPGQGGKDRQSNKYQFLGEERAWRPLPVGHPDDNTVVVLAKARLRIDELETRVARIPELEAKAARVEELEAELARLRNGAAIGHPGVTDSEGRSSADRPADSYETMNRSISQESHTAIRQPEVTDGPTSTSPEMAPHSYENAESQGSQESHATIRQFRVTDSPDEGQEYLARRGRVEALVMRHRDYFDRSFDRRGSPGAIEYFSRSADHEADLLRQVRVLDAGHDPGASGSDPPAEPSVPPPAEADRYAVGQCPDCGKPFGTYGGAECCTDCTERRRRESEA